MIVLQAPHPGIITTMLLPNPMFGDESNPVISLSLKRAIDGTVYTYIKTNQRKKIVYTFDLTVAKSYEVKEFFILYFDSGIMLTDYQYNTWVVKILNPNIEFKNSKRNTTIVELQFEGVKING